MMHGLALLLLLAIPSQSGPDSLERLVDRAVRESRLRGGKVGVSIRNAGADTALFERNAAEPLALASNTKLLTTAAALARLGADFNFQTVLAIENGELHVFGGGDPTISGRFYGDEPTALFREWAAKLVKDGVTKLSAIVLHAGIFDGVYLHPEWIRAKHDQGAWWCAPVGALSLNDNCVDILYEAGNQTGDPVKVTTRPATAYVTIVNRAKTVAASPKPFGFFRREGTNEIVVQGELKVGMRTRTGWVAIQDPTIFFGTVLKETLELAGLTVGGVREAASLLKDHRDLAIVLTHQSPLGRAVQVCNTVSQNFHAEMICKILGWRLRGEGTTEAGLAVVREFLEKSAGVAGVELVDGSGLARGNRASARAVCRVLEYMRGHAQGAAFFESLAVNGAEPGTLARRMASMPGKVRAKTGHIAGVSTLSGYLETAGGGTIVFSILCNDWKDGSPDAFQNRLLELLQGWKGD